MIIPIQVEMDVEESRQEFDLDVEQINFPIDFDVATEVVARSVADYDGAYVVIPDIDQQILPTENKRMREDVTVTGIPYYEVSNVKGVTVYIANQLGD